MSQPLHAVTGAFGYSGRQIAARLLHAGVAVRTLTNSPVPPDHGQSLWGTTVDVARLTWDDPAQLTAALRGVAVLYNTYWVRFNHRNFTHARAVANTTALFTAARAAGVRRVVHVSITNPQENCPLEYFHGKGVLERTLMNSGLDYTILRPAVLFGREDILINNIAWMLRRFPVFGVFGDGQYKLQPIHVDDLAALAVDAGTHTQNTIINAIGPETFTYRDLARTLGQIIGHPRPIISVPPALGYAIGYITGKLLGDVLITREEIRGLMQNRLFVDAPPPARAVTKLTDWSRAQAATLGLRYANELARRQGGSRLSN